jgi:four helix bundle protein
MNLSRPSPQPDAKPRFASFRDMPVWKPAMGAAERAFTITDGLPRKQDYGFTSQVRRAALSISANVAEAFGRSHTLDKVNFHYIARGSATKTQSHLEYGRRVGYLKPKSAEELSAELSRSYNDTNKAILSHRRSAS